MKSKVKNFNSTSLTSSYRSSTLIYYLFHRLMI